MRHVDAEVVARLRAAGCVFAEEEAALLTDAAAETGTPLAELVRQRVSGTPLEYVVGWAEFRGLRVAVRPGVFVPRRRTAFLVDTALAVARERPGTLCVVDLCCGCGALGLAFATEMRAHGRTVELTAADVDSTAVRCARGNLAGHGTVHEGDLFDALPTDLRGRIDILLANVPYVPTAGIAGMPPEARDHEPRAALDGGADGLDVFRRVAAAAPDWLAPGGTVFFESSREQATAASEFLRARGLRAARAESDERYATVVTGTR